MYDIALENIEVMASPEGSGETGVAITKCSKNPQTYYEGNYCYQCNSSTTSTLIFKCPSSLSKGKINDFDYYSIK